MADDRRVFKQGHLDGLCGIYAIVHALARLLVPDLRRHNLPHDVFREAARAIPRSRYPTVLWEGTYPIEIFHAAQAACQWIERESGLGVDVSRPFLRKRFESRDAFFGAISEATQQGNERGNDRRFILWIDWPKAKGGWSHWAVLDNINDTYIRLVDSGDGKKLAIKGMAISGDRGLRLDPRWTIMFDYARLDGELFSDILK